VAVVIIRFTSIEDSFDMFYSNKSLINQNSVSSVCLRYYKKHGDKKKQLL